MNPSKEDSTTRPDTLPVPYVLVDEEETKGTTAKDTRPLQEIEVPPYPSQAQAMDRGIEPNPGTRQSVKAGKRRFLKRSSVSTIFSEMDDDWLWFKAASPTRPEAYCNCCRECQVEACPACYWDSNASLFCTEFLCLPCNYACADSAACGNCCEACLKGCLHCCFGGVCIS